jgi:hypothetical protein
LRAAATVHGRAKTKAQIAMEKVATAAKATV